MSLRSRAMYESKFCLFSCIREIKDMIKELREDIADGFQTLEEVEDMFQGESIEEVEENIEILKKCCNCGKSPHNESAIIFENAKTSLFTAVLCGRCIKKHRSVLISEMEEFEVDAKGAEYWWDEQMIPFVEFIDNLKKEYCIKNG